MTHRVLAESRMRGNVHVRCGGRERGNGAREPWPPRPLPTLHTVRGDAFCRGTPRHVAAALPRADVLTRLLGAMPDVEVEGNTRSWEPGDVVLICTDGVSDHVATNVM